MDVIWETIVFQNAYILICLWTRNARNKLLELNGKVTQDIWDKQEKKIFQIWKSDI